MQEEHKAKNIFFYPLSILLVVITAIIRIQPEGASFRFLVDNAPYVMLGVLGAGLVFMMLKWHRLMYLSFLCVGFLCLFLKGSINPSPVYATKNPERSIEVVQLNTSFYDGGLEELTSLLLESGADLLSVQEVTPDWDAIFKEKLRDSFPYSRSVVSIGINGMAVYSKMPLTNLETFYYKDIPNITGNILPDCDPSKRIRFVTTYTNPTVKTDAFYKDLREHLGTIVEKVEPYSDAILAMGTYNTVAWSSEMKYFTDRLGLQNSRRSTYGSGSYVFHNPKVECTEFSDFKDGDKSIGLRGTFQFSSKQVVFNDQRPTE
ncbi:MAG: endonuclease/exonuclease/phosphatase family protein [Saprospiraceae bacterium]